MEEETSTLRRKNQKVVKSLRNRKEVVVTKPPVVAFQFEETTKESKPFKTHRSAPTNLQRRSHRLRERPMKNSNVQYGGPIQIDSSNLASQAPKSKERKGS